MVLALISRNEYLFIYSTGNWIPDVGELMSASFPVDVHFTSTISAEKPWYSIQDLRDI